jgi:hypothetical protein
MIRLVVKRASLLLAALTLIGAAFVVFSPRTAAQGGFGYMCDAWEQSCDDGSGILPGGGGTAGGGSGSDYLCPAPTGCVHFGCHNRSSQDTTQVCNT